MFHCIGIAPDGNALGWYTEGTMSWINKAVTENQSSCWNLVTPKKEKEFNMGLSIIDAVRSGKRRRPVGQGFWYEPNDTVLAEHIGLDWEIEERKIEITESEFDAAFRQVCHSDELYAELKKRLFEK